MDLGGFYVTQFTNITIHIESDKNFNRFFNCMDLNLLYVTGGSKQF